MKNNDQIEVYLDGKRLTRLMSSHTPDRGDLLTVGDTVYEITGKSWVVDYPSDYQQRGMTCLLMVKPHEGTPGRLDR